MALRLERLIRIEINEVYEWNASKSTRYFVNSIHHRASSDAGHLKNQARHNTRNTKGSRKVDPARR